MKRDIDQTCRSEVRKAKTYLEFNLEWYVKGNRKDFCGYSTSPRKSRENAGLLLLCLSLYTQDPSSGDPGPSDLLENLEQGRCNLGGGESC